MSARLQMIAILAAIVAGVLLMDVVIHRLLPTSVQESSRAVSAAQFHE